MSSIRSDLAILRSFLAVRLASLNFCLARRRPSFTNLAVFLATAARLCATTIRERSFFLAAGFTAADFVVSHTQQVAGGGPGTVEPSHTYKMRLEFKRGTQTLVLNPPYRIPANDTGAFAIDIMPAGDGIGLCWILHIEFKTTLGTIRTEPFAVTMSKTPR